MYLKLEQKIYFELQKRKKKMRHQFLHQLNIIDSNWSNARLKYLDTFAFFRGKWTIYYLILPLITAARRGGHARRARVCIIWIIHFSVPGKERLSDTAEVALPLTQIIIARSALSLSRAYHGIIKWTREFSLLFSPVVLLISLVVPGSQRIYEAGRRSAKCIRISANAHASLSDISTIDRRDCPDTLLLNGRLSLISIISLGIAVDHETVIMSRGHRCDTIDRKDTALFPRFRANTHVLYRRPDLAPSLRRSYTRVHAYMCVRACVLAAWHLCHARYTPVGMRMPVVSRWLS